MVGLYLGEIKIILIDISQIIVANVAVAARNGGDQVDNLLIKHMIINSIRLYNQRFKREYGEVIICADHWHNWRKDYFPHYKANRKKSKEESEIDWDVLYKTINSTLEDLKQYFPYKVLKVDGCEADDIIGALSRYAKEKVVIVSGDGDLTQLLKSNVKQFHPINKKFIEIDKPDLYLKEKIMRGDDGDGVPNMLSDDDVFVNPTKRQKSIYDTKIKVWLDKKEPKEFCESDKVLKNYERNKMLIDLKETPFALCQIIREEYEKPANGNKETIKNYFMTNRMRNLLEVIEDF